MKRTLVTIAGATALATVLLGSPVAAADPAAACGNGNTFTTVQGAIDAVDWSIYTDEQRPEIEALIAGIDTAGNNDGYVCIKQYKPSNGRDNSWGGEDYVVTRISDNNARGQLA